ncbi:MAG: hypothetical protein CSA81_05885 [Acidobacteria bacterium]|nr:MAG: hypothetical protein CSA81_05885 [Acidobacteriota bacterium]
MGSSKKHNVADIFWDGPGGKLEVVHFTTSQALSELYMTSAELKSTKKGISFSDMLNAEASIILKTGKHFDVDRHFSGIITRFHQQRTRHGNLPNATKESYTYEVEIRPRLWLLTKRTNTKVFQEKNAKDIVDEVLGDHGVEKKWDLRGSPKTREFCVQYNETDFNFISRLLEDEGISFFFNQKDKKVVFTNHSGGFPDCKPNPKIPYIEDSGNFFGYGAYEIISDFQYHEELGTGQFTVNHYNYNTSQVKIDADKNNAELPCLSNLEQYNHRLPYKDAGEGKDYSSLHLEEEMTRIRTADGHTSARSFETGNVMEMELHFRNEFNCKWLLTSVSITAEQGNYSCYFTAYKADQVYRPERKTRKPLVQGLQTAIVTGPSGSKVYLDEMGRCKVQFHWDRTGKLNDRSSMWVRVSNGYAGKDYGVQWIPRVGHEVLVDFINSDPDLPVVVGRVYNDFNTAPLGPVNKWQNILKDIKDNHMIFDAEDGKEEVNIRAQKNMTTTVINNKSLSVGNDENISVGNNQDTTIKTNQIVSIGSNKSLEVGASFDQTVKGNKITNITGQSFTDIKGLMSTNVKSSMLTNVKGDMFITCSKSSGVFTTSNHLNWTGGSLISSSDSDHAIMASGKIMLSAAEIIQISKGSISIQGKNVKILSDEITLTTGGSEIKLNGSGITISGPTVTLKGLIKHNC